MSVLQKITALEIQKKNQRRVSVFLDGKYAFGLQAAIAASLKTGQTLAPAEIEELCQRDAVEVAYERVLSYLSYRPRSCAEIERYLGRHQVPVDTSQAVLERLSQAGFVDDEAFAKYWVENREQFRPRGTRSLRFELRGKGLSDEAIDGALEGVNEGESAYRAAQVRARRLKGLEYAVFCRRLGAFLQRRGFDYDVIKETLDHLWRESQGSTSEEAF